MSNAIAQPPSHKFHYPLDIGDFWVYRRQENSFTTTQTRKVLGDSLLPNGKLYRIIEEHSPPYGTFSSFERLGEMNEIRGPNESVLFKLDIKVGDFWTYSLSNGSHDSAFSQVFEIADTALWSNTFKFARIESFTLPDSIPLGFGRSLILVDSIGIFFEGFESGKLELQGAIINNKIFGNITSVPSMKNNPGENIISISMSYPNPFNHSTIIEYRLKRSASVKIAIFNVVGERIRLLVDSFQSPGTNKVHWNGQDDIGQLVASGIYFYVMEIDGVFISQKAVLFLK